MATMDKQTVTIKEVAKLLGVGRDTAYAAVKKGEIPSLKIGGLTRIPLPALERWLAEAAEKK